MCVLSDRDLYARICATPPLVSRIEPGQLQPASIDLRLGYQFRRFHRSDDDEGTLLCLSDDEPFYLHPHEFVLATTIETITVPADLVGIVAGKSSWARQGLCIEIAGFCDPGFSGQVTLELAELRGRTLPLQPGVAIAQISFSTLSSPAERVYGSEGLQSKYQHQRGPTAARSSSSVAGR